MRHRNITLQTLPAGMSPRGRFTLMEALGGVLLRVEHGFREFIEGRVGSIGANDAFAFPFGVLPASADGVASTTVTASVSKFFTVNNSQHLD